MSSRKFQGKYRIASARLKNYDYSSNGVYFITICSAKREHFFGEIGNASNVCVSLSPIGEIVQKYWNEIPQHFPFVKLDEMVIMPNHVHGIIWIDKKDDVVGVEMPKLDVSTIRNKNHKIEWKPGTIGVIINQFKRICTINSRKINPNFGWQSRFYDHIIRNEKSLHNIRNYIIRNPEMWERDRNNKKGLWL